MGTLQSSLYAVALAVCLLCAWLVRRETNQAVPHASEFLIAYLSIEAVGFVFEWLMLHPASPAKAVWLGALMAESLLVAPCLWLFARAATEGTSPSVRRLPKSHGLVIGAGVLLTLPLIATAHLGTDYANPEHPAGLVHSFVIHTTMLMCVMLFLCQVPYYLNQTAKVLGEHTRQSKVLFSTIDDASLNCVRLLAFAVATKWLVGLLRVLHCVYLGKDMGLGVVFALLDVGVTLYVVLSLLRQRTFSHEERALVTQLECERNAPIDQRSDLVRKYAKSRMDQAVRVRVRRKLEQAMSLGHLYKDNRLTLRALCDQARENPHYVSQVLNQEFGQNFYEFVNHHRIEHAKAALLADPDKTILEIALDSGFNSKSTFNAAFRDHAGSTPTAYRRSGGALQSGLSSGLLE